MKQVLEKKLTIEEFLHKCSHEISVRKFPKEDLSKDEKRHRKKLRRDFKKKGQRRFFNTQGHQGCEKKGLFFFGSPHYPANIGGRRP
jgi:hypothetical protein